MTEPQKNVNSLNLSHNINSDQTYLKINDK